MSLETTKINEVILETSTIDEVMKNLAVKLKGVWVKCDKCGYKWIYKSKLLHCVCSNCLHRIKVEDCLLK